MPMLSCRPTSKGKLATPSTPKSSAMLKPLSAKATPARTPKVTSPNKAMNTSTPTSSSKRVNASSQDQSKLKRYDLSLAYCYLTFIMTIALVPKKLQLKDHQSQLSSRRQLEGLALKKMSRIRGLSLSLNPRNL
jgi:hypothetical protein